MQRSVWAFVPVLVVVVAQAQPNLSQTRIMRKYDLGEGFDHAGQQYEDRAYPAGNIDFAQQQAARAAFLSVAALPAPRSLRWEELGPITPNVAGPATYTGRPTTDSGRITALALSPSCGNAECDLFVGAAGGGVWMTSHALASRMDWSPSGDGIPSNAIGSLIFDPTDTRGRTLYAGTGEPNGSSDSEAGVGLYRSTDLGRTWTLVPGSVAAARDRSIAAIAIDPRNARHIWIGTAVARHGASAVIGGRFTPPNAPQVGLYESLDGGASFTLVFSRPSDVVDPTTANGNDFFRGGISKILTDRTGLRNSDPTRVYCSIFDWGLYRSNGAGGYEQIFASAGQGQPGAASIGSRTEFDLVPMGARLRIYLGDAGTSAADFYRVDDAGVPASLLTNGTANPGWTKLSSASPGTPGFGSYNFCGEQCSYDMVVASPPGRPDTVWIGGQMNYDEIFTANQPSNGRAVQRSVDAGVHFTDMTNDTQSPPLGMHPDQHDVAFVPGSPDVAFLASDGGLVRTSGAFANASAGCATRGISGADLADCQAWLKAIPTRIFSLNDGLATLQFQSLSISAQDPEHDVMGGTQDNGTWAYNGAGWFESVGGDGGQSGTNPLYPKIRMHTYTDAFLDVNFNGTDPLGWDWAADPLVASGELVSFYAALIDDPKTAGTWFIGLQHVWRTKDNGGDRTYLDLHCNEFFGDFTVSCGDWVAIGADLTGPPNGADKSGSYVSATVRAPSDTGTLWAATRRGRLFVAKNADAAAASVSFRRIDTAAQPTRFISGIAVDPANPNHAFVSFSGYNAYTPTTPGHVFEVTYNPTTHAAVWKDLSKNLGDQPITGIALDRPTGDLYAATDFGVLVLQGGGSMWAQAGGGLPPVAVYGLAFNDQTRLLYAATHGRGAWRLSLSE